MFMYIHLTNSSMLYSFRSQSSEIILTLEPKQNSMSFYRSELYSDMVRGYLEATVFPEDFGNLESWDEIYTFFMRKIAEMLDSAPSGDVETSKDDQALVAKVAVVDPELIDAVNLIIGAYDE